MSTCGPTDAPVVGHGTGICKSLYRISHTVHTGTSAARKLSQYSNLGYELYDRRTGVRSPLWRGTPLRSAPSPPPYCNVGPMQLGLLDSHFHLLLIVTIECSQTATLESRLQCQSLFLSFLLHQSDLFYLPL